MKLFIIGAICLIMTGASLTARAEPSVESQKMDSGEKFDLSTKPADKASAKDGSAVYAGAQGSDAVKAGASLAQRSAAPQKNQAQPPTPGTSQVKTALVGGTASIVGGAAGGAVGYAAGTGAALLIADAAGADLGGLGAAAIAGGLIGVGAGIAIGAIAGPYLVYKWTQRHNN